MKEEDYTLLFDCLQCYRQELLKGELTSKIDDLVYKLNKHIDRCNEMEGIFTQLSMGCEDMDLVDKIHVFHDKYKL